MRFRLLRKDGRPRQLAKAFYNCLREGSEEEEENRSTNYPMTPFKTGSSFGETVRNRSALCQRLIDGDDPPEPGLRCGSLTPARTLLCPGVSYRLMIR